MTRREKLKQNKNKTKKILATATIIKKTKGKTKKINIRSIAAK